MITVARLTILLSLMPLTIASARAQVLRDHADAFARANSATWFRVSIPASHTRIVGRFAGLRADSVALAGGPPIAFSQIDSVWSRTSAASTGGLFGAGLGAAFGAVTGAAGSQLCPSGIGQCHSTLENASRGALLGAALGFVIGRVIGSRLYRWQLRFPD
ncbi:MAG: hypothetical protein ACHP7H_04560 [Hyphomicrobiales bacterium]